MKIIKALLAIMCLSSCYSSPANAQKVVENQQLLWARYYLKFVLNDTYQVRQEIEERTYWFPWRQNQFVTRTMLQRSLGKGWKMGTGIAYFRHSLPNDPEITDCHIISEIRPQVELAFQQKLSEKLSLHHRYWSEFRFFAQPNSTLSYTNSRCRYKLELSYSLTPSISIKAFDEIAINVGKNIVHNVFDQNRLGTSVVYMPQRYLGFEFGYINWFQQKNTGTDFYNRQIFRLTIHHTISFN